MPYKKKFYKKKSYKKKYYKKQFYKKKLLIHYTVQPPLLDYTAHHLKTCNKVVHLSCSMNCAHNERDAYFLVVYKKALFVNLKDC